MMISIILLISIVAILLFIGYNFFDLRKKQNSAKNAIIELQTQLKNRLKLVPEIYLFVKNSGYSEKDMLVNLKKSDILFKGAKTTYHLLDACEHMSRVLDRLNAIARQNSELRTNQEYQELCSKIIVVDEKVAFSKKFYNDSLKNYNGSLMKNPNKIVANIFNFKMIEHGYSKG